MSIFDLGNGWRDLTDEGPGCKINREKEEYAVVQYDGPGQTIRVKKNGSIVATFANEKLAVEYVDAMCLAATEETDVIAFLLKQIRLQPQWQDTDQIREYMERYGDN